MNYRTTGLSPRGSTGKLAKGSKRRAFHHLLHFIVTLALILQIMGAAVIADDSALDSTVEPSGEPSETSVVLEPQETVGQPSIPTGEEEDDPPLPGSSDEPEQGATPPATDGDGLGSEAMPPEGDDGEGDEDDGRVLEPMSAKGFMPLNGSDPRDLGDLGYVHIHDIDTVPPYPGDTGSWGTYPNGPRGSKVTVMDGATEILPTPPGSNNYVNVPLGAVTTLRFSFHLDGFVGSDLIEYMSGDYFTIPLPTGLSFAEGTNGQIPVSDSATIDWIVQGGVIKATFNGDTFGVVWGEIGLGGTVEPAEEGDEGNIEFDMGNDHVVIDRKEDEDDDDLVSLAKTGEYDQTTNEIVWTVQIDLQNLTDLKDYTLSDTFSANQEYVAGSFRVNGTSATPTVSNGKKTITYKFPADTVGENGVVTVTYRTTPLAYGTPDSPALFTNKATIKNVHNEEIDDDDDVVGVVGLHKQGFFDDRNNAPDVLRWEIHISVPAGTSLTNVQAHDAIGSGHTFISETDPVYGLAITPINGATHSGSTLTYVVEGTEQNLTVNLGTVTNPTSGMGYLKIVYYTRIDENKLDDNGWTASNHAWLTWDGLPGNGPGQESGIGIFGGVIRKWTEKRDNTTTSADAYDHSKDEYIRWVVTVNTNQMELPAGAYVEDNSFPNQNLVIDATHPFKVYAGLDELASNQVYEATSFPMTASPLDASANGYKYTFVEGLAGAQTFVFYTKINASGLTLLYENNKNSNNNPVEFKNTAALKYDETGFKRESPAVRLFRSQMLNKSVSTAYNYENRTVTWRVNVNRNRLPLTNAVITDTLPLGLVGNHFDNLVRKLEVEVRNQTTGNTTYEYPTIDADGKFTINLNDLATTSDEYRLTFVTYLTDEGLLHYGQNAITLKNKVELSADGISNVEDDATITVQNPVVTKTGQQGESGLANYIDWVVEVNANQVDLLNAKVSDIFSEHLEFVEGSLHLFVASVNTGSGKLTATTTEVERGTNDGQYDYTITPRVNDGDEHKLTLELPNGPTAYILKFRTKLINLADAPEPIENQVNLTGESDGLSGESQPAYVNVRNSWSMGGSGAIQFSLKKVDQDGVGLPGAEFRLVNKVGVPVLRSGQEVIAKTDENGIATFYRLPAGFYFKAEEIVPPVGYEKEDDDLIDIGSLTATPSTPTLVVNKLLDSAIRIPVKKTVEVPTVRDDVTFTFAINVSMAEHTPIDPVPLPSPNTVTITGAGDVLFAPIVYTEVGEYYYTVNEVTGNALGYTYDGTIHKIKVTVSQEGGELKTAWELVAEDGDEIEFVNNYKPLPAQQNLRVVKEMTPNSHPLQSIIHFTFDLAAAAGTPMPDPASVMIWGTGFADFEPITYEAAGVYTYTLTENASFVPAGYYFDSRIYTITVTVVDDNGQLVASMAATVGNDSATRLVFTNEYRPDAVTFNLPLSKVITGHPRPEGAAHVADFTMKLVPLNGAPLPKDGDGNTFDTLVIHGEASGSFGEFTFEAAGNYKYKVTEIAPTALGYADYDTREFDVTIAVKDQNGELVVDGLYVLVNGNPVGGIVFSNDYTPDPVSISVPVAKAITGHDRPAEKGFTFTLAKVSPATAPMPADAVATINGVDTGSIGPMTFTAAGTYEYTLTESDDGETGYTYDDEPKTVVVQVVDAGGYLVATISVGDEVVGANDHIEFENNYVPIPTEWIIPVEKVVTGHVRVNLFKKDFTFTLEAAEGTPMPTDDDGNVVDEVTITDEGQAWFERIEFDTAGTYEYTLTESDDGKTGYTYDSTPRSIVIVVEDHDGTLVATVTVDEEELDLEEPVVFTNDYAPIPTEWIIPVEKLVTGHVRLDVFKKDFTFKLEAAEGTPMPTDDDGNVVDEITITDEGQAWFERIEFDTSGTYEYTLTESDDGETGYTYDDTPRSIVIVVEDNDGTLVATATVDEEALDVEEPVVFTNDYAPIPTEWIIPVEKVVTGHVRLDAFKKDFTFKLEAAEGIPMPMDDDGNVVDEVTITDEGQAWFEKIEFDTSGTYEYTLTESEDGAMGYTYDATPRTIVIVVEDNDGTLVATATVDEEALDLEEPVVFTNDYAPIPTEWEIPVEKVVTGHVRLDEFKKDFTFKLDAAEGTPLPKDDDGNVVDEITITDEGQAWFESIKFDTAGTYEYTLTESDDGETGYTYDATPRTIVITVVDKDGWLEATATVDDVAIDDEHPVVFTNEYQPEPVDVDFEATKTLKDMTLKADMFSFTLSNSEGVLQTVKNDGAGKVVFAPVTIVAAGEYTFTIAEVKGNMAGVTYDKTIHTVKVTVVDNDGVLEIVEPEEEAEAIVFVNTFKPDDVPKTGEAGSSLPYIGLGLLAGAGTLFMIRRKKKAQGEEA